MKLSICCVTYNHESYIQEAISSFLSQKCNFDFEIIICDDYSTDKTVERIKEVQKLDKFNKIKLFTRENNIGAADNFADAISKCSGEYIAFCDGDDYWTDSNKLQKQVDYMEVHPDCAMTFHDGLQVNEKTQTTTIYKFNKFDAQKLLDFEYVAQCGCIAMSCSIIIRNYFERLEKGWKNKYIIVHDTIHYLSLMNGSIHYIEEVMGVYRVSQEGIWTKLDDRGKYEWIINNIKAYLMQFDPRFHRGFRKRLSDIEYRLSLYYFDKRFFLFFLKYQYYSTVNSLRSFGIKQTLNYAKHTMRYILASTKHHEPN